MSLQLTRASRTRLPPSRTLFTHLAHDYCAGSGNHSPKNCEKPRQIALPRLLSIWYSCARSLKVPCDKGFLNRVGCKKEERLLYPNKRSSMVRETGLEPAWSCPHTDLNRTRLPIPPFPQNKKNGGRGWIRTIVVCDNGFTVRSLWPLGNPSESAYWL